MSPLVGLHVREMILMFFGSIASCQELVFSNSVHLNVAHILDALESAVVFILNDTLALPICSDDLIWTTRFVENSWHLESKKINIRLVICFFHCVRADIVQVAFTKEFSWKSAKDNNLFIGNLRNTSSLSFWERTWWHVYDNPVLRTVLWIVAFNRVAVFATWLCNSAEDINKSVLECATGVVMSSNIEIRNFEPEIEVNIILFTPFISSIIFTSWSSDNKELVIKTADRVTMASIFELIHCNAVKGCCSIVDNLVALLQRGRVFIDFSTSDQEQLITWCLNVHKVVLKG